MAISPPGWYKAADDGARRWWTGHEWTDSPPPEAELSEREIADMQKNWLRTHKGEIKAAERDAAARARAEAELLASPVGQARAAFARGDGFFQLTLQVSQLEGAASSFGASSNRVRTGGRPDLLSRIEDEGFRLEDVGYVFIETGATSTNRVLSTGQGTVTRGFVQGIYLFRRTH